VGLTQGSLAPAHEWASVKILSPASSVRLKGLTKHYGSVPEFSLVERSGKKTSLAALRGKVWIADFLYTNCTETCPLQTADMAKLQEQWIKESDLELVSFSVDPERDTPRVLSQYADRFKADAERWLFLTGGKEEIAHLVEDGFRLAALPAPNTSKSSSVIVHSPSFVLVDRLMQIRGYYDARYPEALQRLKKDVATLLNEKLQTRE
jgi:cytochrome oxidase Cu insertion factor (SCO1/SenC/PrrC family)